MANALITDTYRDPWVRKIQSNYWFMKGSLKQHQGDEKGALEFFERAATVAYDSRTVRFNIGLVYYVNNRFKDAARHLRASLSIDPNQTKARRLLGKIHQQLRRPQPRRH